MKISIRTKLSLISLILAIMAVLVLAPGAAADGGPVIPDYILWSSIKENQQIAVVWINENGTAKVDLFVSMMDNTGESHRITYFVPLGASPGKFQALETTSLEFDRRVTSGLDDRLESESHRKGNTRLSWLPGTVVTHGVWLLPALIPLVLSGCASTAPEATFETKSSQIGIYGLDTQTDISELVQITGLDPSVKETLERIRGQKIAVINLNTQPAPSASGGGSSYQGQPGLHLSWEAPLASDSSSEALFTYPLGTGAAWSKPIEITRIYVAAPRSMDFHVQYPRLGTGYSGAAIDVFGLRSGGIRGHNNEKAYVVEEATDSENSIWRITYTQSNSAEDIIITAGPSGGISSWLNNLFPLRIPFGYTILAGLVVSLAVWVAAWRYILPRRLKLEYTWSSLRLWRDALVYPGINLVAVLFLLPVLTGLFFLFAPMTILLAVPYLLFLLGFPVFLFIRKFHRLSSQPKMRLFITYIYVVLAANAAYLVCGVIFSAITGTL